MIIHYNLLYYKIFTYDYNFLPPAEVIFEIISDGAVFRNFASDYIPGQGDSARGLSPGIFSGLGENHLAPFLSGTADKGV